MARQRIINPEFWLDYEIASIENPNACLFYIGTWNFCDDYGVIENNALKLKAQIFPYREVNVAELIDIFVKNGKFILFESGGKSWIFVKNFLKFQKIRKPSQFRNPEYQEAKNEAKTALVREECVTSAELVREECVTSAEPVREECVTSAEPVREECVTSAEPVASEEKRRESETKEKRREENAREGGSTRQRAKSSSSDISGNAPPARKGKPFFWGQEMRKAQGRWWVLPKEGGAWKEFYGKEADIAWK